MPIAGVLVVAWGLQLFAQDSVSAPTGSLCVLPHVERAQAKTSSPEVPAALEADGRPFSAFSFSFTELGRSDLCLSQSGVYLTWRFHPSPQYSGCQCKGVAPAAWSPAARSSR
jgi:hypothetical protein